MRYVFFIVLLLIPATSYAAELRLEQQPSSVSVEDTFVTSLFLRTGIDVINAVEGSIRFSSSLSLVDIRLQGSLVPLWISPPTEKEKGVVTFAGVLPGGYQGEGNVLTLVFKAVNKGTARISFGSDTMAYQNDGNGTSAKLFLSEVSFSIEASSGIPHTISLEEDTLPPEPFTPVVSSGEPFGLEGRVLIFTTQDKNSGIARYDIARSYYHKEKEKNLSWNLTESPYVFVSGDSTHYLYVRAVDRAGNTRIAVVPPQEFSIISFVLMWWAVLLLLVGVSSVILSIRFYRR
ncbi:MAG: cohesin domain-containing protein [Candidatus Gottesmanbacteria bacterium]|nr:cohesin domain-containing protein [Candidatus Gottesmanbacteria bacterium]